MQELTANRADTTLYQCRCVLLAPDLIENDQGRCTVEVPPDSPFCEDCENRHPDVAPERVLAVAP